VRYAGLMVMGKEEEREAVKERILVVVYYKQATEKLSCKACLKIQMILCLKVWGIPGYST